MTSDAYTFLDAFTSIHELFYGFLKQLIEKLISSAFVFLMGGHALVVMFAFAYVIKSLLGINLMEDAHLMDLIY